MQIIRFIFLTIIAFVLFSCNNDAPKENYNLTCKIDKKVNRDSISVFIFENEYNKLRKIYSGKGKNGIHNIKGYTNTAKAAFLKLGNDSTPLFFILEPTRQDIIINTKNIIQKGGKLNIALNKYIKERSNLESQKKVNFKIYSDSVQSGGMTSKLERKHFVNDSILTDSIERLTHNIISLDSAAIRPIIKRLYGLK